VSGQGGGPWNWATVWPLSSVVTDTSVQPVPGVQASAAAVTALSRFDRWATVIEAVVSGTITITTGAAMTTMAVRRFDARLSARPYPGVRPVHPVDGHHDGADPEDGRHVGDEQQCGPAGLTPLAGLQGQPDHGRRRHQRHGDGHPGRGVRDVPPHEGDRVHRSLQVLPVPLDRRQHGPTFHGARASQDGPRAARRGGVRAVPPARRTRRRERHPCNCHTPPAPWSGEKRPAKGATV